MVSGGLDQGKRLGQFDQRGAGYSHQTLVELVEPPALIANRSN